MKPDWCLAFIHKQKYTEDEIQAKWKRLYRRAKTDFPPDGCFSTAWLERTLNDIDRLWYHHKLCATAREVFTEFKYDTNGKSQLRIAGSITYFKSKDEVVCFLNKHLANKLFRQSEQAYLSHGLLCNDRLSCLLQIFLHESAHVVTTICERVGTRPDPEPHDKTFQRLCWNLFRHTDMRHGLIPRMDQWQTIQTLQRRVRKGSRVQVFNGRKWVPAKVLQRKGVFVTLTTTRHPKPFEVELGLVRLPACAPDTSKA